MEVAETDFKPLISSGTRTGMGLFTEGYGAVSLKARTQTTH